MLRHAEWTNPPAACWGQFSLLLHGIWIRGLSGQVCLQEKQAAVDRLKAEVTKLTQSSQAVTMVSENEATLQGRLQLAQVHLPACSSAWGSMLLARMRIWASPMCMSQASSATRRGPHTAAGIVMCHVSAQACLSWRESQLAPSPLAGAAWQGGYSQDLCRGDMQPSEEPAGGSAAGGSCSEAGCGRACTVLR